MSMTCYDPNPVIIMQFLWAFDMRHFHSRGCVSLVTWSSNSRSNYLCSLDDFDQKRPLHVVHESCAQEDLYYIYGIYPLTLDMPFEKKVQYLNLPQKRVKQEDTVMYIEHQHQES